MSSEAVAARPQASPAADGRDMRVVWAALTAATVIAVLRLPFLSHQSLWLDEIYTRSVLREPSLAGLWRHLEATESTPPLYYLIGWLLHARSAAAMRLIPALSLIAAVPVSYLAFRRLIGSRAAFATVAIIAVNPMLVAYSTDARSYGLFVLTALLSVWGFSALLQQRSARRFALWVVASVACIWSHYFGVFVVAGEVILLLIALPQTRLTTACWSALIGLCTIPLVPLVASQTGNERAGFIAGMPLGKRLLEAVRQLAMGANVPRTWLEAAGLAVFCLATFAGIWLALRGRERSRLLLALAAIVFLAPLALSALKVEDRFYARNMIATLPLAAALAAPAMLRLRATPLAIYLALATLTSIWVATDWRYQQVDWRGALAKAESLDRQAPVLAVDALATPVIDTYLARAPASAPVLASRAWLIVEPVRSAGHRFLGPASTPSLAGFVTLRTLRLHGFQLILLGAARPTPIAPGEIAGATLFAGAPLTARARRSS